MPFVSQAQRRKFYATPSLHKFIPEFEHATGKHKLPERVHRKKHKRRHSRQHYHHLAHNLSVSHGHTLATIAEHRRIGKLRRQTVGPNPASAVIRSLTSL